ncbi:hypothetical protein [Rothia dentocariosa]|uniref:hypothetical protein n=1 Tax=Rothia dentocariosa TaxID=2047 RepID=UPI0001E06B8A|nr:hypothetical protein [Rothia dentocariosa]EFJ78197.1 hypothetical protein HMPREF0734_01251 [Rothia dentocariosa M567]QKI10039.1 hypothetical protein FOC60_09435 [Rothia dentocariosa]
MARRHRQYQNNPLTHNPLASEHLKTFDRAHPAHQFLGQYTGFLNKVAHEPRLVFIDETMHEPHHQNQALERRFYAISAVIVENPDVASLREDLKNIIGGQSFWHTTDAASEKKITQKPWLNQTNLQHMMDTIGNYSQDTQNVLTFHSQVRYSPNLKTQRILMEQARAESITAMLKILTSSEYSAQAFVFERRHNEYENNIDRNTIHRLTKHKIIPSTVKFIHTTSSIEPNLWAPDLQAWGIGQEIRRDDSTWLTHAHLRPLIIDAQTLEPLRSTGPYVTAAPKNIPAPSNEQQLQQVIDDLDAGVYNREIRDFEAQLTSNSKQEGFQSATHESMANQARRKHIPRQHAKDLAQGSKPIVTKASAEVVKNLKAQAQKILEAAKQKPASQPQANNITPPDPSPQQPHPSRGPRLN